MRVFIVLVFLIISCSCQTKTSADSNTKPNVIIIFTDDMGWGDLSCYGNPNIKTPHLDKMATEGSKFTHFYVASPVCTPSRAALLTGCYPKRVGLHQHVLFPTSKKGLNPTEVTMAAMLKKQGYKTALFGKWHLGHHKKFLPPSHGFDEFYGIPYSNDMSRKEQLIYNPKSKYKWPLPLMRGYKTIGTEPDQTQFTKNFTEEAVKFIKKHSKSPFFIYLAHPMPHIPIYASKKFKGKSLRGLYGDTIEEIDWSVGEVLKALKEKGIDKNTLVVFTSDNGPWLPFKTHGGSAGPLRDGKGTTYEGGQRVPCIMRWPAKMKGGQINTELVTTMDLLPTIAKLTGAQLPKYKIDGISMVGTINSGTKSPREFFVYYDREGRLSGIRDKRWKLRIKTKELFDLNEDISEKWNLYKKKTAIVERLLKKVNELDAEVTKNQRKPGFVNP